MKLMNKLLLTAGEIGSTQFPDQLPSQPYWVTTFGVQLENILPFLHPVVKPNEITITQQVGGVHDQSLKWFNRLVSEK